jgi:hypothetical protein
VGQTSGRYTAIQANWPDVKKPLAAAATQEEDEVAIDREGSHAGHHGARRPV